MNDLFQTNLKTGLSSAQVASLLAKFGYNKIAKSNDFKLWKLLLSQFSSVLVLVLLLAAVISFFLGHLLDAVAILVITLINAAIGFAQEYKAENAVNALQDLVLPSSKVLRDGLPIVIDTELLVPGDIVILDAGDKVPADIFLRKSFGLQVDESILTGESVPVNKQMPKAQQEETKLYKGTLVTNGRAVGVVYATGSQTEFGKIVNLVSETNEPESPLNVQLRNFAVYLMYIICVLLLVISALFFFKGLGLSEIFMTAVALGVSAIPEGLPVVITLTLALGVQTLSRKKAIVRKLNAIETLGATTVICTDKTGTLTQNEMTVTNIFLDQKDLPVTGSGYKIASKDKIKLESNQLKLFMHIANSCNNASISESIFGDPTEIALKVLAKKAGISTEYEILDENVFSSERKMMSSLHKIDHDSYVFAKGACEVLLEKCTQYSQNGQLQQLDDAFRKQILAQADFYAKNALRVLALAYKQADKLGEEQLVFLGLVAMIDPPRPSVAKAVKLVKNAGIDVKIITGDNPVTAMAIAKQIGFDNLKVTTGSQIDQLNNQQLLELLSTSDIFARTSPKHKFRIVQILQAAGEVVSVSGDGVNDAPALKQADVGVAMGIKGTQATKEVADIVLKDDNFSTIVTSIAEGRRIYSNILSFIKYMLGVNFCTIASVSLLTILGRPLPILPLQILFINIATDALPALALGQTKARPDIMSCQPRNPKESFLRRFGLFIVIAFVIQTVCNVVAFEYGLMADQQLLANLFDFGQPSVARTMIFAQIILFELVFVFVCKADQFSLRTMFNDKNINLSVLLSLAMLLLVIYVPYLQTVFKTSSLALEAWGILVLLSLPALSVSWVANQLQSRFSKSPSSS